MSSGKLADGVSFDIDVNALRKGLEAREALKTRGTRGDSKDRVIEADLDNIRVRQADKGALLDLWV